MNEPPGARDSSGLVVRRLESHLTGIARARTVRRAVAGTRFCAVLLDDGSAGVANIAGSACHQSAPPGVDWLPPPGTPAAIALAGLDRRDRSAIGLATANALANRSSRKGGRWDEASFGGDVLAALELTRRDRVGMVGHFAPLVDRIRRTVEQLFIFERAPDPDSGLLPETRAFELLPECSVAMVTATTVTNGTCDAILAAASNCREVVLLGPSTPLVPEVFAGPPRLATLLAGIVVVNPEELLHTVAQGGGTRDFGGSVAKVNVRVSA